MRLPGERRTPEPRAAARSQFRAQTAALERSPILTLQRSAGNRAVTALLQRQVRTPVAQGAGSFARAQSTAALTVLLREAERRLTSAGAASFDERVRILSGVYYGTPWSRDREVEKSPQRDLAFQIYTGRFGPGRDPRPVLGASLFGAIKASQDVVHPRMGKIDVGHLIIGLNSRMSGASRSVTIPTQGATGLDIVTWVGDLGGATGQLAKRRLRAPSTPASAFFGGARGTDYGADSNLEGDVAAYVAASSPGAAAPEAPVVVSGAGVADVLDSYFAAAGPPDRTERFLTVHGGVMRAGALTNRSTVEAAMAVKLRDFARWYMGNRYGVALLLIVNRNLPDAARDVAHEFVDWLLRRVPGTRPSSRTSGGHMPSSPQPDLIDRAIDILRSIR